MKYGILSILALIFGCFVYAQDVDALLKDAEKAERDLKEADEFVVPLLLLQSCLRRRGKDRGILPGQGNDRRKV